jgi:hypothetical protein
MTTFPPFEKCTLYKPATTTTTNISGWESVSSRCWGCKYSYVGVTRLMCACMSRTFKQADGVTVCESYREKGAE